MTPKISAPHFRHILARTLSDYGRAPLSLDVTREPPALVLVTWDMGRGSERMSIPEETVIDKGGPDWIARLILLPKRKRKEELSK